MKNIIINKDDAGQRLDRFLSKAFPNLSQGVVQKALRMNRIKLNNKRISANYKLVAGDELRLYMDEFISEKITSVFYNIPRELNIIYEDENLLILDKQPGLPVHEDNENSHDTLINRVLLYLQSKGEYNPEANLSFRPSLCNRIDRNTGGIVLAAKNAESLRIISEKLKNREIMRLYLCIVHGKLKNKTDTLTAYHVKFSEQNKVKITSYKLSNSKKIVTAYKVVDECKDMSLLSVNLLTGRTHQIRSHLAFIGHPIVGDGKYGQPSKLFKYQTLYSVKLRFDFTSDAGILGYLNKREFEANDVWFLQKYYEVKNGEVK